MEHVMIFEHTLVCLNSRMASVTKFLKFPIFRKVDVFSTKMTIFLKTLDMLV